MKTRKEIVDGVEFEIQEEHATPDYVAATIAVRLLRQGWKEITLAYSQGERDKGKNEIYILRDGNLEVWKGESKRLLSTRLDNNYSHSTLSDRIAKHLREEEAEEKLTNSILVGISQLVKQKDIFEKTIFELNDDNSLGKHSHQMGELRQIVLGKLIKIDRDLETWANKYKQEELKNAK